MTKTRKNEVRAGQRFGRWTVVDPNRRTAVTEALQKRGQPGRLAALCRCDCGTEKLNTISNILSGTTQSCGCLKREKTSKQFRTHGLGYEDYRYRLWRTLMGKCYRPTHKDYGYYGARGISVHAQWHDSTTFMADLDRLLGLRPEGYTLDRINNDGNYEPGNVRWASRWEQTMNRRMMLNREEAP